MSSFVEDPYISVYTTVYNSIRTVEQSIKSIAKALNGINYEIVVVDNYSVDGTYEKIVEMSKYYPIRVFRYRSTRGLGRRIAASLTRGKYLVYVDLDCLYTEKLRSLIELHLNSKYRDEKSLSIIVCPRKILIENNFSNANRFEDLDFFMKLAKKNLIYVIPVICEEIFRIPLRIELRTSMIQKLGSLIPTFESEKRYVKSFVQYLRREFFNKLDQICFGGYTPSKFFREEHYVYRKERQGYSLANLLIRTCIFILFYVLIKCLRRPINQYDRDLSNFLYADLMLSNFLALPDELNIHPTQICLPPLRETIQCLNYVLRYKRIEDFRRLWLLYKLPHKTVKCTPKVTQHCLIFDRCH
ncbi:MAG: glycosyltransferase family 2 protein [Candidatus Bathyarchaeia archaeon]